ncbi:MAG: sugar phosphate nucleotidyltransferase, partial [Anaerolineaceae bacterium]|nr:sugar phosphate nucleotidyltransferase [Anaerolineaceae bacterium]
QLLDFPDLDEIHLVSNARYYPQFLEWKRFWEPELEKLEISLRLYNDGICENENRLGSIGDLEFVLDAGGLYARHALVAAGDSIFHFDLQPYAQTFAAKRKNFVLSNFEPEPEKLKRTGVLTLGENDRVIAFIEKPPTPPTHWSCLPFYFLTPPALLQIKNYRQSAQPHDAIGHYIRHLVENLDVYALRVNGIRYDIGSINGYTHACAELSKG